MKTKTGRKTIGDRTFRVFEGDKLLSEATEMTDDRLAEFLMVIPFKLSFTGWSIYPMAVLILVGALLIYLDINRTAREIIERKLFF